MIKVLHLTYDMRIGGTEMVIKNLIKGNTSPSIEMSIYCIESPLGPWGKELEASGIKITTDERQPQLDFKLIRKLRKHLKKNRKNLVKNKKNQVMVKSYELLPEKVEFT